MDYRLTGIPYYTLDEASEILGTSTAILIRRFEVGDLPIHKRITFVHVCRENSEAIFEIENPSPASMAEAQQAIRRDVPGWEGINDESAVEIKAIEYRQCNLQDLAKIESRAGEGYVILAESVAQALAPAERPSDTKKMDSRERNSYLRLIRALEVMAGVPKRGGTASVEKQLRLLGFNSPREATIRGLIEDARAIQPDDKPQ